MSAFPPLEALVPHRGRMLLVTGIVTHTARETCCRIDLADDGIIVHGDGSVSAWVALELMAQTVAVHAGLTAWSAGQPVRLGFLIGARHVALEGPLRGGQSLHATVSHVWGEADLAAFDCVLREASTGALRARGQLSVAVADAARLGVAAR
jgi:predicted hotdog family 3-hydroxylacyl-ACP dehydratase